MKRILAVALALCMLLPLTACAAKQAHYDVAPAAEAPMEMSYATEESAMMDAAAPAANTAAYAVQSTASSGGESAPADADTRKIIYNANLDMTVDDPTGVLASIVERCKSLGGYVSESYTTTDDFGTSNCSATLKVPADLLETLVNEAKGYGKVNDYRLSSDDISLSYYDIAARLDSAKAEEKQLLDILEQCHTVEDILAVRESLASVRADIESYQAQINLWDNLVGYATLSLYIRRTPQPAVAAEPELLTIWKASDVWKRMSRGFINSARFVVNAIGAVGIFLAVAIIPAAILFACIVLPILLVKKRRRRKAAALAEQAAQSAPVEEANGEKQA